MQHKKQLLIVFSLIAFIALSQCTKNAKIEEVGKDAAPNQHSKTKEPKEKFNRRWKTNIPF
jgi:ABC-type transporter lipoprotein component MlaA